MKYIAIDTETAAEGHICEIAWLEVIKNKLENRDNQFIKPSIYPGFDMLHQNVHKITAIGFVRSTKF